MGMPAQRKQIGRASTSGAAMLNVREGAHYLGTSEKSIRHLIGRGRLPHRRIGRRVVLVKAEIDAWIDTLPGVSLADVSAVRERTGG